MSSMDHRKNVDLTGMNKRIEVEEIAGDGGCLFGALLHQLFGFNTFGDAYQDAIKDCRRLVVMHMRRKLGQYAVYLYPEGILMGEQCSKQIEQALNEIERGQRWGGEESILAMTELFSIQIVVVHNLAIYRYGNSEASRSEQCWLYYHDFGDFSGRSSTANHYDSIVKCTDEDGTMEYEWSTARNLWRTEVKHLVARDGRKYNAMFFEGCPDSPLLPICHQLRDRMSSPLGLNEKLLKCEVDQFCARNSEWLQDAARPPGLEGMSLSTWELVLAGANVLGKRITVTNKECERLVEVVPDMQQRANLTQNLILYFDAERQRIGSITCTRKRQRGWSGAGSNEDNQRSIRNSSTNTPPITETETEESEEHINVASWNVRGCCRAEKRDKIDAILVEKNIHVALLQEVNTDCESAITDNYKWHIHKNPGNKQRGLAALVRKASGIIINNVERVSDNIMKLTVVFGRSNVRKHFSIINVHAPNKGIARFLGDLGTTFLNNNNKNRVIMCGDFNAQLGKDTVEIEKKLIGPFVGHEVANENGIQLKFFMRTHNLVARNTMAHPSLLTTWFTKNNSSQIDHVLTTCGSKVFVKKLRGHRVNGVLSDHKLLTFKTLVRDQIAEDIKNKERRRNKQTLEESFGWDVKLLQEEDFKKKYQEKLSETTVDVEDPSITTSEAWESLAAKLRSGAKVAINKLAKIPSSPNRRRALANLKKAIFWKKRNPLSTRRSKEFIEAQDNYRKVHHDREEKEEFEFFKNLQQYKPGERIRRTYKYLKQNKKRRTYRKPMDISLAQFQEDEGEDLLPVLIEEPLSDTDDAQDPDTFFIETIIKGCKNGKVAGEDGIQIELLKYADGSTIEEFKKLLKRVWRENDIPDGWRKTLCVPIPKKKNAKVANDFRKITLASAAYKVYASWLLGHLIQQTTPIGNHQAGFLNERSTVDHIFTARRIMEEKWNAGDNLVVMSLDIEKAFDSISLKALASVLESKGASRKLANRVINCLIEEKQQIFWKGQKTAPKMRRKGVKQGCPLSPYIFDLMMEEVLLEVESELGGFLKLNQEGRIKFPIILVYADDILIIARTVEELEKILPVLKKHLDKVNLNLNDAKCQVLVRSPGGESPAEVKIDGIVYKTVKTIYHLGVPITERLHRPLTTRKRSKDAVCASKAILEFVKERKPSLKLGKVIYETIVSPTIAYGTQAMVLTKRSRNSLRRYEKQIFGQIKGLCDTDGQSSSPSSPRSITKWIRILQLRYWGHIIRRPENHLLKLAAEYRLPYRKRGRPSFTWWDTIAQSLWRFDNISVDEWYELAGDKEKFNKKIEDLYNVPESASEDEENNS